MITDIRKKVFTEVAHMAYTGEGYEATNELPYTIVPGDRSLHRESVFLERVIAGERVRLAMGLGLRSVDGRYLVSEGMGCPGGCVAGPGTILPVDKATKFVDKYSREAASPSPTNSPYRHVGEKLD